MARVIHTGDTHIGYRQYHSSERKRDFLTAFERVIEDAIDEEVDAVIHAGDLFHDTRPAIPDLMATVEVLRRLATADIPFLAVVGNHEATRDRQWLDLFADLDLAVRLDDQGIQIGNTTLYGLDYVPPSRRPELSYDFAPSTTEHAALVAHGLFEPFAHADWDTERLVSESSVSFEALLLGDNHTWGQERLADTLVTYCGSTERASASEREARGYNLLNFEGGEVTVTRRRIDAARRWEFIDVSLHGEEGTEHVIEEGRARALEDAVVIVRITGDGTDISPAVIEERLTEAGALLVRVFDEREISEDETPGVQFADPDRAVDERLQQLALSGAGELVDAVVRDETVVDANVRERVRSRMETLLDEAPDAFERRPTHSNSDKEPPEDERPLEDREQDEPAEEHDPADHSSPDEATEDDGQASIAEFG